MTKNTGRAEQNAKDVESWRRWEARSGRATLEHVVRGARVRAIW